MYTKIKGGFYQSFVDDTVDKGQIVEKHFNKIEYMLRYRERL